MFIISNVLKPVPSHIYDHAIYHSVSINHWQPINLQIQITIQLTYKILQENNIWYNQRNYIHFDVSQRYFKTAIFATSMP